MVCNRTLSTVLATCEMKQVKVLVAQLCPTLYNPMNFLGFTSTLPGSLRDSSTHGILQARILE